MITNTTTDCTHSLAQCSDMPWCIRWIFGFINRLYREARCAHWCGGTSDKQHYSCSISGKQKHSHSLLRDSIRSGHIRFKADSHIACRAHAAPMPFPCHAVLLIHTCHAAPPPRSDSAVSFVKVGVVAGNIRTASPTV